MDNPQKLLTKEELQERIDYLNCRYPDARLKIEDFLAVDVLMEKMTQAELEDFVEGVTQTEPEREYYHEDEFGVDSTLLVMAPGVVYECGRILGEEADGGSYVYYNDTLIYLRNLLGSNTQNLSYNAFHRVYYSDYSGVVNSCNNVHTNDGGYVYMANAHMMVSSGPEAKAIAYYCYYATIGGSGIISPNIPVYLHFNATSLFASVSF